MLDPQGQRLAKRHDALSLRALREQGKKPEELVASMHITDRFSLAPE